jgi:predicted O-methyltransferase YrrM
MSTNKSGGSTLKSLVKPIADLVMTPITFIAATAFKKMRENNFRDFPRNKKLLFKKGVFPILDHYYEPMFNTKHLQYSLRDDRELNSLDMNAEQQLELLNQFRYNDELLAIPMEKTAKHEYHYNNGSFLSGDSEYLYNMIRHLKPANIIEIGSGFSTLMALKAIEKNKSENATYNSNMMCVEPYEMAWLEKTDAVVIRKKVEDIEMSFFEKLEANDILFIDSSHIIRPQGDVLFIYLRILPVIKPGVYIHIHDIFTPKDYLDEWIYKNIRLWNEQYLVEAFLSYNEHFKITGALNFLRHNYYNEFSSKCPILKKHIESGTEREPGSLWLKKVMM